MVNAMEATETMGGIDDGMGGIQQKYSKGLVGEQTKHDSTSGK
jgi:hypothetical protein